MGATNVVRWLTTCIALAAFFELRVTAQDTDAVCTLASLQWSFNTEKQSPCAVASSLLGVCSGGDATESTALPSTTSTTSSTQSSVTVSQTSSAPASASSTTSTSESLTAPNNPRSNAIGGGVVGGILGLALLLLLIGCSIAFRRRRRIRALLRTNSDSEQGALSSPSRGILDNSSKSADSESASADMSEIQSGVTTTQMTPSGVSQTVPSMNVSSSSDK
ncbi:hypothetical protein HHX47_DHR1000129 [Lentinula edodes]|nr:hypothetical protein HHX47_DHR1000129 [Lentinula edodes]